MHSRTHDLDVLKVITLASMLSSAAIAAAFLALILPQSARAAGRHLPMPVPAALAGPRR